MSYEFGKKTKKSPEMAARAKKAKDAVFRSFASKPKKGPKRAIAH